MRPELETYHQIDSYLNGRLEGDALRSFEQKVQSDAAFAEEVEFQKLTNQVVVGASYNDLRAQMTKDIDRIDASDTIKKWSLYGVAAAVLLSGAAGIYSYSTNSSETTQTKAAEEVRTAQRSASAEESSVAAVTKNPKSQSSILEAQTSAPKVQEAITYKIDSQQVITSSPQPSHTIVPEKTTPEIRTVEPTVVPGALNPCAQVQLSARITTTPSCTNESTGSIAVSAVTGGTKPYHIALDELSASARTKESYAYLKAETYTVRITDANGCVKTFAATVAEKVCKKNAYVFVPDKGETWRISGNDNETFTITLINMAGTQVYRSHPMQGEFEWQGIGQQGEYLSAGLYIYVIEYANGQKENGQVTIVR